MNEHYSHYWLNTVSTSAILFNVDTCDTCGRMVQEPNAHNYRIEDMDAFIAEMKHYNVQPLEYLPGEICPIEATGEYACTRCIDEQPTTTNPVPFTDGKWFVNDENHDIFAIRNGKKVLIGAVCHELTGRCVGSKEVQAEVHANARLMSQARDYYYMAKKIEALSAEFDYGRNHDLGLRLYDMVKDLIAETEGSEEYNPLKTPE